MKEELLGHSVVSCYFGTNIGMVVYRIPDDKNAGCGRQEGQQNEWIPTEHVKVYSENAISG